MVLLLVNDVNEKLAAACRDPVQKNERRSCNGAGKTFR